MMFNYIATTTLPARSTLSTIAREKLTTMYFWLCASSTIQNMCFTTIQGFSACTLDCSSLVYAPRAITPKKARVRVAGKSSSNVRKILSHSFSKYEIFRVHPVSVGSDGEWGLCTRSGGKLEFDFMRVALPSRARADRRL